MNKHERIVLLDILRGCAMIYVMLYHVMFDICFIFGRSAPPFLTPGNAFFEALHVFFLWILFAVSGMCSNMSRSSLKRGTLLYIAGYGITVATELFMPSELIVFGVLSCFGACMVICDLLSPLINKAGSKKYIISAVCVVLWFIFRNVYHGRIELIFTTISFNTDNAKWLYPLGIIGKGFASADYFPLIPYIFMFLCGKCAADTLLPLISKVKARSGPVGFIGKHSLIFYAAHQPLILLLLWIVFSL